MKRNAFKNANSFRKSHSNNFFMRKINRVFHILKSFTGLTQGPDNQICIYICTCIYLYLPSFPMCAQCALSLRLSEWVRVALAIRRANISLLAFTRIASHWINIYKHPLESAWCTHCTHIRLNDDLFYFIFFLFYFAAFLSPPVALLCK